jgi:putative peptidoglycan lipid II flippase
MIKRIFNSQIHSITGAALVLGAASFISRLIGIVRDRIFAHFFGAGDALDIYYAAFRIPDIIYNLLVAGALTAGFIPVFLDIYVKNKKQAKELIHLVITTLSVLLIIVCFILIFTTHKLVPLIVPGFTGEKLQSTILLTRIMFLSPIILGISGVLSGVLQSLKSFVVYSLTPIFYNLGIILGVILFYPIFGLKGLAFGVILGTILHLAIQLPSIYLHGFTFKFAWDLKNKVLRKIGLLMIPRTLALATSQINLLVMTIIASTLGTGSIAVFNFANNLQYFPIGLIGISFALAAFPTFSELIAKGEHEKMGRHLVATIRQILFFILPLTIIFLLLRAQIVRVVLGSGEFDWTATIATADTLAFFSLSLFAQCLIPIITRSYYALKDTWTPFNIAFASSLINIIASLLLKDKYGIAGLGLAYSIAMIFQLIILSIYLRKKLPKNIGLSSIFSLSYSLVPFSIIMAVTIQTLKTPLANMVDMNTFIGIFTQGAVSGTIGLCVYFFLCHIFNIKEMAQLRKSLHKKWLNFKKVQGEIGEADKI